MTFENALAVLKERNNKVNLAPYPKNMTELGKMVFLRTYSRYIPELKRRESWRETTERAVSWSVSLDSGVEEKELFELFDAVYNLHIQLAGRTLWTGGTEVSNKYPMSNMNCTFTTIENVDDLADIFYLSMLGSGVGFSLEEKYVGEFPLIRELDVIHGDYTGKEKKYMRKEHSEFTVEGSVMILEVGDSKEGWTEALKTFFDAHTNPMYRDMEELLVVYDNVRPKGERLKTFGGFASGHEYLEKMFTKISTVISNRNTGGFFKLQPIDMLDIANIIGENVVSGGVRRTAQISLFDNTQEELILAKSELYDPKTFEPNNDIIHRALSNNSVLYFEKPSLEQISAHIDKIMISGEPAFINGEQATKRFEKFQGVNPCAEILLRSKECCNLVAVDLALAFRDGINFANLFRLATRHCYRITTLELELPQWKKVLHEDRLLGVSINGLMDYKQMSEVDNKQLGEELSEMREFAHIFMKEYAEELGLSESKNVTTIKPTGCSKKESMVITDVGILHLEEIGDVNGEQWQDLNINVARESDMAKSDKFYVNGNVETRKITTDGGVELESSLTHQYKVLRDGKYIWVKTPNLKVGDIMPYRVGGYDGGKIQKLKAIKLKKKQHNHKIIKQPNEINEDLAWLLGLYLADGSTHDKGIRIASDKNKHWIAEEVGRIALEQFGIEIKVLCPKKRKSNNEDIYINSTQLLDWMRENNLIKPKTKDICIPIYIRKSPKNIIEKYIDGYGVGDGCTKTNRRTFCTISKKMSEQLVAVLRALGMDAKVRKMPPTKTSLGDSMRYWISQRDGKSGNWITQTKERKKIWAQLNDLGLKDLSFDKIVSIESSECDTFDISVPDNHTYIGDSYVNHNTQSLLGGMSAGVHNQWGEYFIRRVRLSSFDPIFKAMKEMGYELIHEKGDTYVVEFPCKSHANRTINEVSAIEQLEMYKLTMEHYTDQNTSCTINVGSDEWEDVKAWMYLNWDSVVGVSFLPKTESYYPLLPYEAITKEKYDEMTSVQPFFIPEIVNKHDDTGEEFDLSDEKGCETGHCPLK